MSWLILIVSGALEAVWAAALDASDHFSRLWPSVIFVLALAASMFGLSVAMRDIPLGTAYAVWVGIGAVLTVGYAAVTGVEPISIAKIIFLLMIVAGVVGLKAVT